MGWGLLAAVEIEPPYLGWLAFAAGVLSIWGLTLQVLSSAVSPGLSVCWSVVSLTLWRVACLVL